ncbi:iron chaperone [Sphingobacterium griseoflavum]|uniref:YdhG-like domain-containing protein n=1 Tax=Sphingobacterium griseoflavum TaxID=1474952 RepID=A0ABQ3HX57_9SPHI|nr:DUF1801 domain-containing protein [Sphingobacterium griseoflavum]GHE31742.1 hypothetical protein GCM10017764_13600 [Sphingobacterium griseoflavum]
MDHKAFTNIDEYIAQFDTEQQALLQRIREILQQAAPMAEETISYQMPTFRQRGNLIHFALFKNHLGIYPGPEAITHYQAELAPYKTSKGTIQLPLDAPLPQQLLQNIVRFNLDRMNAKA